MNAKKKIEKLPFLLCSAVALTSLLAHVYLQETEHGAMQGQVDFSPVYIAAKLFLAGDRESIYGNDPYGADRDELWMAQERALPDGHYDTVFSYMPAYLMPVLPFVYAFDYASCVRILTAINLALAAFFCAYLAVQTRFRLVWQLLLAGVLAHAHVITETIDLGQNMLIAGAFIYLFFEALDQDRNWRAIVFFLIAAISKPWAFLFAGYALVHRKYLMVVYLGASLALVVAAQALWDPELFAGYLKITVAHSEIAVLAHNNVALTAGIHRLLLDDWVQYLGWFDAGAAPFFLLPLKLGLAASAVFIGWLSNHAKVMRRSVLVAVFVMLNVYWDFYLLLFLPLFLVDLFPFSRYRIPLLLLGLASFFWSQITLYPFFNYYLYRFLPGGATGTIVAAQLLLPACLVAYLYANALLEQRTAAANETTGTESG